MGETIRHVAKERKWRAESMETQSRSRIGHTHCYLAFSVTSHLMVCYFSHHQTPWTILI